MPNAVTKTGRHAPIAQVGEGSGSVALRRFDPALDSYGQLTSMLHRAFARLAAMGLNCTCVDQTSAVTERRASAGDCFVAVNNGHSIGTLTLYGLDNDSPCDHYHRPEVATVRQFGIDPSWQQRGIGKALLRFAEHWAAMRGYAHLALDTPYPAAHLVAFYRAQGFRIVDVVRFAGKVYDSAILSKPLLAAAHRLSLTPEAAHALAH